ncbi:hypothetical protein BXY70_1336 [Roseovarius halotolerans]|uniref:Uncharacterized protein n=1 Tax=Roseovarius halotolerans TaxID=505353 RepID=A0A1X6Y4Y1_9RHOB|nr:hypothetical protein [Roseovarius halotolerans]RKT35303.1 hypothetical protein BXY70_1336 [Roseovarius halotolerans]SLN11086.1 hypothetical protein ROH8110_00060 [Roseovarius halotolerans]
MTKTMKKPSYLGTTTQIAYKSALADAEGTYAKRHSIARRSVGKTLEGQRIALVRVSGVTHVVAGTDIPSLPSFVKPHAFCILEHCDGNGAIFVRSV